MAISNGISNQVLTTTGTPAFATVTANTNVTAGLGTGGSPGSLISFPTTTGKGSLIVAASDNATGSFNTTITNALAYGQSQVITIPDSGATTAKFILSTGTQTIGNGLTLTTPVIGAASATSIAFTSTSGIIGTTTNDNAAAGSVGQYAETVVPFASRFSIATNTAVNTTSISLTAGDWDVWGNQGYFTGAGTNVVDMSAWVSATSATQPDLSLIASVSLGTGIVICATGNAGYNLTIPMQRFSLATTTTIYLSSYNNFSVNTLLAYGAINARRVR